MVLGDSFLISFQESPGDVFEPVRERLRRARGRIRKAGSDYLAWLVMIFIAGVMIVFFKRKRWW
jgi:magnesium transporter